MGPRSVTVSGGVDAVASEGDLGEQAEGLAAQRVDLAREVAGGVSDDVARVASPRPRFRRTPASYQALRRQIVKFSTAAKLTHAA